MSKKEIKFSGIESQEKLINALTEELEKCQVLHDPEMIKQMHLVNLIDYVLRMAEKITWGADTIRSYIKAVGILQLDLLGQTIPRSLPPKTFADVTMEYTLWTAKSMFFISNAKENVYPKELITIKGVKGGWNVLHTILTDKTGTYVKLLDPRLYSMFGEVQKAYAYIKDYVCIENPADAVPRVKEPRLTIGTLTEDKFKTNTKFDFISKDLGFGIYESISIYKISDGFSIERAYESNKQMLIIPTIDYATLKSLKDDYLYAWDCTLRI